MAEAKTSNSPVKNYDWGKVLTESTGETIRRQLESSELTADMASTEEAHRVIRRIVADEFHKLQHKFATRTNLIAPNNVAYAISTASAGLLSWSPQWWVVMEWDDGTSEEYQALDREAAMKGWETITASGNAKTVRVEMR